VKSPNFITWCPTWDTIYNRYVIRCGCKMETKKTCVHMILWCSKYANHSRLYTQHKLGEHVRPLNKHKNLHFDYEWIIHMSCNNYEANGYGHTLDLPAISHTNCMFLKVETPIHDNTRELVTWECKEHGVKSWMC